MGYTLSRKAEEDLIAILLDGTQQFGLQQAERYHDHLKKAFEFLADNPFATRERMELAPPIRIHPVGSHIVLYTVGGNGDIFIVRVRHGHEDWLTILE